MDADPRKARHIFRQKGRRPVELAEFATIDGSGWETVWHPRLTYSAQDVRQLMAVR